MSTDVSESKRVNSGLDCDRICAVFNACFSDDGNPDTRARMVRGGDEPQYRPATRWRPWAELVYARDLAPSCLHEAAHWLRAGPLRRRLADFGYWYLPDGRDDAAQRDFEALEAEVQAIEWILAFCAGVDFRISADNLRAPEPSPAFRHSIAQAVMRRCRQGQQGRLLRLAAALATASSRDLPGPTDAALAWA